jgi:hypothetical protein
MGDRRNGWKWLLAGLLLLWGAHARALILDFGTAAGAHALGDPFSVSVLVSGRGAGQAISGYDFTVAFDPGVLALTSVAQGNALCDQSIDAHCQGNGSSFFLASTATGVVNLLELSFAGDARLLAQQGEPLVLVTLVFTGIGEGLSALSFDSLGALWGGVDPLTGAASDLRSAVLLGSAEVTITPFAVPEPPGLALAALALALALAMRVLRRRRR